MVCVQHCWRRLQVAQAVLTAHACACLRLACCTAATGSASAAHGSLMVMVSVSRSSSMRACASAYVSAARLAMTLLVKRTLTTSASGVISQIALKASRSTPPLQHNSMRACVRRCAVVSWFSAKDLNARRQQLASSTMAARPPQSHASTDSSARAATQQARNKHEAAPGLRAARTPQAAYVFGQRLGKHVDATLHQVGRGRPAGGLQVHGAGGRQKVRHVGDVHAHLKVAVGQRPAAQERRARRCSGHVECAVVTASVQVAVTGGASRRRANPKAAIVQRPLCRPQSSMPAGATATSSTRQQCSSAGTVRT